MDENLGKNKENKRLSLGETVDLFARAERFGKVKNLLNCSAQSVSNWRKDGVTRYHAEVLKRVLGGLETQHEGEAPTDVVPTFSANYWEAWRRIRANSTAERLLALELASLASFAPIGAKTTVSLATLQDRMGLKPSTILRTVKTLKKGGVFEFEPTKKINGKPVALVFRLATANN